MCTQAWAEEPPPAVETAPLTELASVPSAAAESASRAMVPPPLSVPAESLSEAALKKQSEANTKMPDKNVKRVIDAGLEIAARGADPETQILDKKILRRAEERFTLVIEELAPSYTGGYTARANVRVAIGDYDGAVGRLVEWHRPTPS